ncbi:MAG: hypothetical protein JXB10_02200 [Pirellulales bacterium]|nr:hypothetical protein [Pirellulales bacterium]
MSLFRGFCLAMLLGLATAGPGWAQGIRRSPRQPPKLPEFNLSGKLDRIVGNRIALTTEAGFTWIVQPKPKVEIHLTGKAVPAFLAPGQCVAFWAKLDKRRCVTLEPVRRLTVFTPDKRRQFGIQPDLGFGELEKETLEKRKGSPDPAPPRDESPAGRPASGGQQKPGTPQKVLPANVESFIVHGRILSAKKGELLVQVPNNVYVKPRLKIAVAEDAKIDVELAGLPALALVQPGDHVQARGEQVGEGLGYANILAFRAERPLGAPPEAKKPPPKKKTK